MVMATAGGVNGTSSSMQLHRTSKKSLISAIALPSCVQLTHSDPLSAVSRDCAKGEMSTDTH